jgi:hypothetical protein
MLPLMAEGRILPYLDVPFQHAHPDVLKRMKRPASGERNLERLAEAWRAACPQIVVRSTFIAGFPGETEAEFEYLLDFLREAGSTAPAALPIHRWGAAANDAARQLPQSCAKNAAPASWPWPKRSRAERLQAPRGRHHAGAGRPRAGAGPQGRHGPQLCRCARDRRPGAPAAAGKGQQDAEGGRVHARPHRRHRKGTTSSPSPSEPGIPHVRHEPATRPAAPTSSTTPTRPPAGFASAVQVPVHKASTVIFADTAALRARDWRRREGYTYGLHGTPTSFVLEERIATLEGGRNACWCPAGWRPSRWSTRRC